MRKGGREGGDKIRGREKIRKKMKKENKNGRK
jgi:hypothetical protein